MLRRESGALLMEAVVALFLVAFGLMAMAAMQIRTLTETRNSASRQTAAQLASDLLDRLLVNTAARTPVGASPPYESYLTTWSVPATPDADCRRGPCSSQQLALFDLWQWKTALRQQLPEGDAQIFRSSTDPTQLGVLFRWKRLAARNESTASTLIQQLFAAADEVRNGLGQAGTGVAGIACTSGYTCHLTYIRP